MTEKPLIVYWLSIFSKTKAICAIHPMNFPPPEEKSSDSTLSNVSNLDSTTQNTQTDPYFPIVGIAASAGGLEAFTELIRHLPTDTGMAFVLVQHLSPDHESLLSEILGRATEMPVRQVEDRMRVEPNEIYVIPPNTQMTLVDGLLHLAPRQKTDGKYLPGEYILQVSGSRAG